MGKTCSVCNCNNKESEFQTEVEYPDNHRRSNSNAETSEITRNQVVKLQAWWRGYRVRKSLRARNYRMQNSKYFSHKGHSETTEASHLNLDREERPAYKFKNGAVYIGQWRGTVRDGYGIQTWPDGSRYEGQWKDSKAHGK